MDISGLRTPYNGRSNVFLESQIAVKDPYDLFHKWFEEAKSHPNVVEPNAMCLATATCDGSPSARFVLCKGYGKEGFHFYTHYNSRKGLELVCTISSCYFHHFHTQIFFSGLVSEHNLKKLLQEENPKAALTFFWAPLSKSIRIEGYVKKLPLSYADDYFNGRPYQSQIGALCSQQSKVVEGRDVLSQREVELKNMYKEGEVPRPQLWGGYAVIPHTIEFWQGQTDRIHDRIRFRLPKEGEPDNQLTHPAEDGWVYERLQP